MKTLKTIKMLKQRDITLDEVTEEMLTYEVCLLAVGSFWGNIKYVPEGFLTEELCIAAVESNSNALFEIDDEKLTDKIVASALRYFRTEVEDVEIKDIAHIITPKAAHIVIDEDASNLRLFKSDCFRKILGASFFKCIAKKYYKDVDIRHFPEWFLEEYFSSVEHLDAPSLYYAHISELEKIVLKNCTLEFCVRWIEQQLDHSGFVDESDFRRIKKMLSYFLKFSSQKNPREIAALLKKSAVLQEFMPLQNDLINKVEE